MQELRILAQRFDIKHQSLKKALTHYSFYNDKNDENNNSKHVFAGMFVFKGILANTLLQMIDANGSQLQHILGNLLSNSQLEILFDKLNLQKHARASENFDIRNHKHIFVYGFLGCLAMECSNEQIINSFISNYILQPNEHILYHNTKNKDLHSHINMLAKQLIGKEIKILTSLCNEMYHSKVVVNDGEILSETTSKSYKYARSKALKIAIKIISEQLMSNYQQNSNYLDVVFERAKKEEEIRLLALKEKQELKKKEKEEKNKIRKQKAIARDIARRKAQQEAKERRKRKAELEAKKAAKAAQPVSSKKRRFLEDKTK